MLQTSYAAAVSIRIGERARTVRDPHHLVVVVACVAIAGTAATGGGYLPTAWGWATLGPAAVAAAALLMRRDVRLTRVEVTFVLLLVLLVAWTALSLAWTDS